MEDHPLILGPSLRAFYGESRVYYCVEHNVSLWALSIKFNIFFDDVRFYDGCVYDVYLQEIGSYFNACAVLCLLLVCIVCTIKTLWLLLIGKHTPLPPHSKRNRQKLRTFIYYVPGIPFTQPTTIYITYNEVFLRINSLFDRLFPRFHPHCSINWKTYNFTKTGICKIICDKTNTFYHYNGL